ncbi:MAG: DUF2203 domain-containing protein [Acidimicrobiia bacterium]
MRFWTLDEATAALPEVRALVARLRELVTSTRAHASGNGAKASGNGHGPAVQPQSTELREVLETLTDQGIVVRDPERGLIDFPAQTADGRTYLLCWLDGEDAITWWHWEEDGFAGRTPLSEPPE